jgi:hypothetical protein
MYIYIYTYIYTYKYKGKVVPLYFMKVYRDIRNINLPNFYLGTTSVCVVNFTPQPLYPPPPKLPQYVLNKKLSRPHRQAAYFERQNYFLPLSR